MKSFKFKTVSIAAAVLTVLLMAASAAQADPYIGRMNLLMGIAGGLPIPILGARPNGADAPGGNGVGNALVMGAGDIYAEDVFTVIYPSTPPFLSTITHANFGNGAGTLAAGSGPGTTTFCGGGCVGTPSVSAGNRAGWVRVSVPSGRVQFGGVQAALGNLYADAIISSPPGVLHNPLNIQMNMLGGTVGQVNFVNTAAVHDPAGWTTPVTLTDTGMPWTTGKIIVEDATGTLSTLMTATGIDTTVSGFRNIQLITGVLNHFTTAGGAVTDDNAGIMTMSLDFVPEPGATALLGAGLAMLPLIYAARNRKS